jgi:hypothetical protein
MAVRLTALLVGRALFPRNILWYSFLLEAQSTPGPKDPICTDVFCFHLFSCVDFYPRKDEFLARVDGLENMKQDRLDLAHHSSHSCVAVPISLCEMGHYI